MSNAESRIKVLKKERERAKKKPTSKPVNVGIEYDSVADNLKEALGFSTKSAVYSQLFKQLFEKVKGIELTNPRTGTTFLIESTLMEITNADLEYLVNQAIADELKQEAKKKSKDQKDNDELKVGDKEIVRERGSEPKSFDDF